jgi:hypothetical protein
MTLPPCLVAKTKGAGEAEIQRVVGGAVATIVGLSWGASTLETPAAYDTFAHNRALQFTDGELYAVIKNSIRKLGGGTWTENKAGAFTTSFGSSGLAGLYMLDNTGVPTMVVFGQGITTVFHTETSTDGTTWTGTDYSSTFGITAYGNSIVFRNSIFWTNNLAAGGIAQYDVVSDSITTYDAPPILIGNDGSFAVFDNTLYFVAYENGLPPVNFTKEPALFRFEGGAWSLVQNIGGGTVINGNTNAAQNKVSHSLYERGGNLYALVCGADSSTGLNPGVYHYKLVPNGATFTETDITVATLPTAIRSASAGGSANSFFRISTITDNDTDPTTRGYYFQMLTDDSGGTTAYWVRGDDATLFADGSVSANVAWPEIGEGGGERFYTSGGPSIYCTKMEKNPGAEGGMKLTFHGEGLQTGKTVEVYVNNDEEAPITLATFVAGTVTGGTATNTTALISDVDLDGTVYTVIVNIAAASLSNGDKATIAAFIAS